MLLKGIGGGMLKEWKLLGVSPPMFPEAEVFSNMVHTSWTSGTQEDVFNSKCEESRILLTEADVFNSKCELSIGYVNAQAV